MKVEIERLANAASNFLTVYDRALLGYVQPEAIEPEVQILELAMRRYRQTSTRPSGGVSDDDIAGRQ